MQSRIGKRFDLSLRYHPKSDLLALSVFRLMVKISTHC
jgi:hypothetical protein